MVCLCPLSVVPVCCTACLRQVVGWRQSNKKCRVVYSRRWRLLVARSSRPSCLAMAHHEILLQRKIRSQSGESRHGRTCCRLDPVVNDPKRSSGCRASSTKLMAYQHRISGHRMAPHTGSPARPERPGALPHVGRAISHESPSARQSKRISPFSWPRIMLSITRVPKP